MELRRQIHGTASIYICNRRWLPVAETVHRLTPRGGRVERRGLQRHRQIITEFG